MEVLHEIIHTCGWRRLIRVAPSFNTQLTPPTWIILRSTSISGSGLKLRTSVFFYGLRAYFLLRWRTFRCNSKQSQHHLVTLGYPCSRTRGKFEYSTFVSYIQCANHTFDDLYTMASFTEMADSEPRQLSRSLNVSTLASKFQQVNTTVHVMFFLHHIDHFLVLKL